MTIKITKKTIKEERGENEALTGLAEAGDALLQELQREMGLVGCQRLADGDDEEGVVGRDAKTRRLQQLALDLQVEGAG